MLDYLALDLISRQSKADNSDKLNCSLYYIFNIIRSEYFPLLATKVLI